MMLDFESQRIFRARYNDDPFSYNIDYICGSGEIWGVYNHHKMYKIEEIQNQLNIKEGVINVLLDRVEELESNLEELELELYEQTKEFKRYQIVTNQIMNNDEVLRPKFIFMKYKSEREENEKIKGKWWKSEKMLEKLQEMQG